MSNKEGLRYGWKLGWKLLLVAETSIHSIDKDIQSRKAVFSDITNSTFPCKCMNFGRPARYHQTNGPWHLQTASTAIPSNTMYLTQEAPWRNSYDNRCREALRPLRHGPVSAYSAAAALGPQGSQKYCNGHIESTSTSCTEKPGWRNVTRKATGWKRGEPGGDPPFWVEGR